MTRVQAARHDTLADRWPWLGQLRARTSRLPGGRLTWRVLVAVAGAAVVAVGVLLLPLPGPGWLIIFAGMGVWATEFAWAGRLLRVAREQVRRWSGWARRQSRPVQAALGLAGVVFLAAVAVGSYVLVRAF